MEKNYLQFYEQIPSFENLNLGITTRVFAKRLRRMSLESEKSVDDKSTPDSSRRSSLTEKDRRPSKFLSGASIPNSIIKADLKICDSLAKSKSQIRRERDAFVADIVSRLQPKERSHCSIYDETIDRQALARIKEELQKNRLTLKSKEDLTQVENNLHAYSSKDNIKKDPWQELKEKRRISRRTSVLAPLGGERRSTYESIKKAIQNSKIIQQLIDADKIEVQKMKQIHSGKSLTHPEYSFVTAKQEEESTTKTDESKTKILEKKVSSRKSSMKRRHSQKASIDRSRHLLGYRSSTKVTKKDSKPKSSILRSDAGTN